jgi:uncharacterized protein DUF2017
VPRRGIERRRDGSFAVHLPREERELLAELPGHVHALLDDGAASVERLFPPAYADDPEAERDYRSLVGSSLVDGKLAALGELARTAGADRLTETELESWLGALESIRLVVGTQLGVTEESYGAFDPSHPEAPRLALYHWLSWLQEEIVQALATTLPAESGDG